MIEVEQLSLFTMLSPVPPAVAVCCMDGSRVEATPAESWMQRLVQGGEFKLYLDGDLFKVMITFVAKNYSK